MNKATAKTTPLQAKYTMYRTREHSPLYPQACLPKSATEHLQLLETIAQHIINGQTDEARHLIDEALSRLNLKKLSDIQLFVFLMGLVSRINPDSSDSMSNLYLKDYALQQIDLFNILGTKFPLVSETRQLANEMMIHFISRLDEVVIVSIGIGAGHQEALLLERLAQCDLAPKKLTLIGIEPAAASLQQAEAILTRTAETHGLTFEFRPIQAFTEDLPPETWADIAALPGGKIVNAAYALHHTRFDNDEFDLRDQVLKHIKSINPVAFVLCEPNSDHYSHDLVRRTKNAWNHFGLVFRVIDRLDLDFKEKLALMTEFFGREVEDILGGNEATRSERHEPASSWLQRLANANFTPYQEFCLLNDSYHDLIQVSYKYDYLSLDFEEESIVAIMVVH